jgi:hypothetical protein
LSRDVVIHEHLDDVQAALGCGPAAGTLLSGDTDHAAIGIVRSGNRSLQQ